MGCGCKERRERMKRAAARTAARTKEFFDKLRAAGALPWAKPKAPR